MIKKVEFKDFENIIEINNNVFGDNWFKLEKLQEIYDKDSSFCLVFEEDNKIIGYIVAERDWEEPEIIRIITLSTLKEHRGKGIGKALVKKVEEICKEKRDVKFLLVDTEDENPEAIRFYLKIGFKIIGYLKFFDENKIFLGKKI